MTAQVRPDKRTGPVRIPLKLDLALIAVRIAAILAVMPFAIGWRTPLFASWRITALVVLLAVPLLLILAETWTLRRVWSVSRVARAMSAAALALAAVAFGATGCDRDPVSLSAPRRPRRRRAAARTARAASPRRLSRRRDLAGLDRSPRHRGRVPLRAQCPRQDRRDDPPRGRRAAAGAAHPGARPPLDRDRPGRRHGVPHVAAAQPHAADRRHRHAASRPRRAAARDPAIRGDVRDASSQRSASISTSRRSSTSTTASRIRRTA